MTTALTTTDNTTVIRTADVPPSTDLAPAEQIEYALARGDFRHLSSEARVQYLDQLCASVGLNPLSSPFAFFKQKDGRLTIYARKDCTEQLRKLHSVTLEIISQSMMDDLFVVHVRATMPPTGKGSHKRTDEDVGAVVISKRGEDRANDVMRAITKAKRRVTLSICGLGFLDESEVATIEQAPAVEVRAEATQPVQSLPAPRPALAAAQVAPANGKATIEQIARLIHLRSDLAIEDEDWAAIVGKRGVTTARDLTPEQADELIAKLAHMVTANQLEAEMLATDQAAQDQRNGTYSPDGLPVNGQPPYKTEGQGTAPATFPGRN